MFAYTTASFHMPLCRIMLAINHCIVSHCMEGYGIGMNDVKGTTPDTDYGMTPTSHGNIHDRCVNNNINRLKLLFIPSSQFTH